MMSIKLWIKRVVLFLLIAMFSISSIGCWNRRELNTIAIIQAVGVDKASNNDINLTFQIIKPEAMKKSQGNSGRPVITINSTGETDFDAFRNGTFSSDRKLFLPHNKVIVLGEALAQQGIAPTLDFFARDHEGSGNVLIFISKSEARGIIEAHSDQESISAKAIENLSKTTTVSAKVTKATLDDFFKQYTSDSSYAIIPGIKVENGDHRVTLADTAIFKKDKLVGWLGPKETRGLLWVWGKVKSTVVIVASPKDESKKLSLEVLKEKKDLSVKVVNGEPVINLKINVKSTLGEQLETANLISKETIEEIEKRESMEIKQEVEQIISKAKRELDVDIFSFGSLIHKLKPKVWAGLKDDWDNNFKSLKVNVEVNAKIVRSGLKLDTTGKR